MTLSASHSRFLPSYINNGKHIYAWSILFALVFLLSFSFFLFKCNYANLRCMRKDYKGLLDIYIQIKFLVANNVECHFNLSRTKAISVEIFSFPFRLSSFSPSFAVIFSMVLIVKVTESQTHKKVCNVINILPKW